MNDSLFLPKRGSQGTHYHAAECGAHLLREVPRQQAEQVISMQDLEPCENCIEDHGLEPIDAEE